MKKTISLILILTIGLFSLTGCTELLEVNDFYYIIGLGIDRSDGDLLRISVQLSKNSSPQGSSSSMSDEYKIYTVEAETIESGINILNNYLNKKINLSHCSAIIFSESIARSGIGNHITSLANNTDLRHACTILVSEKNAYDILNNVSKSGESYSARLYDYLSTSTDYTGYSIKSTFGKMFKQLNNSNHQAATVYAKVNNDIVQNSGIAVFKEDKMVGTLDILNTLSHLIIKNELEKCVISVDSPFKDGDKIYINLELYKDTEISVNIINNSPFITVNVYPTGNISSSGEYFDYSINDNITKVKQAANKYLTDLINEYLYNISKTHNSDIAGFGIKASSNYLTKDEFDKIHWYEIFKDSFFEVNVHTQISSSGLLTKK